MDWGLRVLAFSELKRYNVYMYVGVGCANLREVFAPGLVPAAEPLGDCHVARCRLIDDGVGLGLPEIIDGSHVSAIGSSPSGHSDVGSSHVDTAMAPRALGGNGRSVNHVLVSTAFALAVSEVIATPCAWRPHQALWVAASRRPRQWQGLQAKVPRGLPSRY